MPKLLRVLLAEDSQNDALLILRALSKADYAVQHEIVDTAEAMSAALAKQEWDVVLSDYSMPKFSGLNAMLTLQGTGKDIPFIIISGAIGEEKAAALMKHGAHDYVNKENLARLVPIIEKEMEEAQNRRLFKNNEKEIVKLKKAVDSASESIFMTDENQKFTFVNRAFSKLYGYTPEEVIGKLTPSALKNDALQTRNYEQLFKKLTDRQAVSAEVIDKNKSGQSIRIEMNADPIIDGRGNFIGILAIQKNIQP